MAIFTASAASDGAVLGLGGLPPVRATVATTTMASDTNHPKMNAAPFLTPPLDASTRMKAVRGIGSRVMARPMITRSRVTAAPIRRRRHPDGVGYTASAPEWGRAVGPLEAWKFSVDRSRVRDARRPVSPPVKRPVKHVGQPLSWLSDALRPVAPTPSRVPHHRPVATGCRCRAPTARRRRP